jgi:hypothetical protein
MRCLRLAAVVLSSGSSRTGEDADGSTAAAAAAGPAYCVVASTREVPEVSTIGVVV